MDVEILSSVLLLLLSVQGRSWGAKYYKISLALMTPESSETFIYLVVVVLGIVQYNLYILQQFGGKDNLEEFGLQPV